MRYFYADADRRTIGPVSDGEVFRLIRDGVLTEQSSIRVEGAEWETVGTLVRRQAEDASRATRSTQHVCTHCDGRLANDTLWCLRCGQSTRAHVSARLASPAKRLVAQVIDWVAPSFGTALIATYSVAWSVSAASVLSKIGIVVWAVWSMMLYSNGMTPGKWIVGVYVIDGSGDTASFMRMLGREIIGKTISMLCLSLGFVWILVDDQRQGWHDKMFDTYVVED